jgi:hypothetical protein
MFRQQFAQYTDIRRHLHTLRNQSRGRVLELGVRGGSSTAAFLAAAEDGRVAHVWSVDVNDCGGIWAHGHESWTFIQSDSLDKRKILAAGAPQTVETLFIDTSHTYPHTLRELETWGPLVNPGGVIFLHDAYEEPVERSVREYCDPRGLRYALRVGSFGMFVIWPSRRSRSPRPSASTGRTSRNGRGRPGEALPGNDPAGRTRPDSYTLADR